MWLLWLSVNFSCIVSFNIHNYLRHFMQNIFSQVEILIAKLCDLTFYHAILKYLSLYIYLSLSIYLSFIYLPTIWVILLGNIDIQLHVHGQCYFKPCWRKCHNSVLKIFIEINELDQIISATADQNDLAILMWPVRKLGANLSENKYYLLWSLLLFYKYHTVKIR